MATVKKSGMKVEDVATNSPEVADMAFYGLKRVGIRKVVAVVDVDKRSLRILSWLADGHAAVVKANFGRAVVTEAAVPVPTSNNEE